MYEYVYYDFVQTGIVGSKGSKGNRGPVGFKGEKGFKGEVGDVGPVGDKVINIFRIQFEVQKTSVYL